MSDALVEKANGRKPGLGSYGFAAMFRSGAYVREDAQMVADKFQSLGDEIERLQKIVTSVEERGRGDKQ
jgi:hypothetical protein